ncbi:MAG: patatin-like phospholipase family protein [Chitinophagaceae bacterium]
MLKTLMLACCPLFFVAQSNAQRYKNLALEGGGIRGIAYAGAMEILDKKHITDSLRNIAGTSVGAIAGALVCVGYNAAEIKSILYQLKIQDFNDGEWFFLGGQRRMRKQLGWYKGDVLERWIEKHLEEKTGKNQLTFEQLHLLTLTKAHYKDLYVTATNLSRQRLQIFSWKTTPNMLVSVAVRTSMSIPLYFRAMKLDSLGKKSKSGDVYADGGILMNYPIGIFDSGKANWETLGLKLERPEQVDSFNNSNRVIAPYQINSLRSYIGAFYNLVIETLNRKTSMQEEAIRSIYISTAGIEPRVRKLRKADKDILVESGRRAAENFFRK